MADREQQPSNDSVHGFSWTRSNLPCRLLVGVAIHSDEEKQSGEDRTLESYVVFGFLFDIT